ncbi:MAG: bifunctional diaminohydroxyphosphoribosylaminopyrimidine deaminase/5-amino-6-(5-phosphoribosylamino)uracil reductase RibD [Verrucomicrobiae bacterium]|nr:bifunctional diaminohydroxyphosphoribosylaminopyrimidine deaminase/5-amino-6-(5-phosphoribosylamino)uracil reductase RibD [Verrucomicrobiae bacterium]
MRRALRLARRALGETSPNPMVGAIVVRGGEVLGEGWHRRAGGPHAEIEALEAARRRGHRTEGATLVVTLEPCCTHGRTPPCTGAIVAAGIRRVVAGATDPNPRHAGRGFDALREAGVDVATGVLGEDAARLNEGFNHWIRRETPWVTLKAAMSLDGRLATRTGESRWVSGERARAHGQRLRRASDAILVGIGTVLADNPALTLRRGGTPVGCRLRVVLDTRARTPADARVVCDAFADRTRIVVGREAPEGRVAALRRRVVVWTAPLRNGHVDLRWVLKRLGRERVTSVLVEGGGEVHAAFLEAGLAHRISWVMAPLVIGGREAPRAVAGDGFATRDRMPGLDAIQWRRLGDDLLLEALVVHAPRRRRGGG